jgi:hypothetical protein
METGCVPVRHEMNVYALFRGVSLAVFKGIYENISLSRRGFVQNDLAFPLQ